MKTLFTFLVLAFIASTVSGQVFVTNSTGEILMIGFQTTDSSPNLCPGSPTSVGPFCVPVDAVSWPLAIPGYIYATGCYTVAVCAGAPTPGSTTYEVNEAWNPACYSTFGPLEINWLGMGFGSGETHIEVI